MSKQLDYKLTEAKADLVKGEQSQEAIVNQEPKESVVNTISVNEVKEFDKKNDTKQDVDIEEIKNELSKRATIHNFEEATILTDEILAKVKSGDIVKMASMEFVVNNKVNQTPRSITGKIVDVATEATLTIIILNWVKGQALEPTRVTYSFEEPAVEPTEEPIE